MRKELYENILRNDLFKNIPVKKIKKIPEKFFQEKTFNKMEFIIKQHSSADGIFLIVSGDVVITKQGLKESSSKKAQGVIINRCSAGEVIGELAIISDNKRAAYAIAYNNVETIFISKDNFLEIRTLVPEISLNLEKIIAGRLGQTAIRAANERNKFVQLNEVRKQFEENINQKSKQFDKKEVYEQISFVLKKVYEELYPYLKNINNFADEIEIHDPDYIKQQIKLDIKGLKSTCKKYLDLVNKKISK